MTDKPPRKWNPAWKDTTRNERQARRLAALNEIAISVGYESWRKLETAAINNQIVIRRNDMQTYTISDTKLADVIRIYNELVNDPGVNADPATDDEIESAICADWPEGDEHQRWLNTASAAEIADWLVAMELGAAL